MGEKNTEQFDDLLQPMRSLGWTAAMGEDGALQLRHPLWDVDLHADTREEMRRMLHQLFAPDSAFMEALREAPRGRTEELAVVGDIIRVCRAFASSPRLPSAVVGVLADRGFVDDTTDEWLHEHAEAVVSWTTG
jgi:hypothetical protein